MAVFLDTSSMFAVLDADDRYHADAARTWASVLESGEQLVTSNYVLVECFALIGRRLGLEAVRAFQSSVVPILEVSWVDAALHERAVAALLTARDRQLSLVDCASFELMREMGLEEAFAFDEDFADQGFRLIP